MNYFLVRANWKQWTIEDKIKQFISNNYWETGYNDKYAKVINSIKKDDILLLADGSYIKYYSKCKENPENGRIIYVKEWIKLKEPIVIKAKGNYRKTISKISNNAMISKIENFINNKTIFIHKLNTKNFTKLPDKTLKFKNINIFIGENGSGKSQILKLLYSIMLSNNKIFKEEEKSEYERQRFFAKDLIDIFKTKKLGNLVNFNSKEVQIDLDLKLYDISFKFSSNAQKEVNKIDKINFDPVLKNSVFIPTKEILSFYKSFRLLHEDKYLQFDKTYYELARALERPFFKESESKDIENSLEKILNGKIDIDNGEFFLIQDGKRVEINLIAEGLRKIAMISYLIANGSLDEDGILFWDEPEANMHPKLIDDVVQFLVILANRGMQIFVSTHSPYVIESFNNHLKRFKIKDLPIDNKDIHSLEPLDFNNVTAYLLEEDDYISLIDKEYGLIDDKLLEEFNQLNLLYDRMRDIEWNANG